MPVIVKEGLRDIVYKRLHEMVENGRFPPGTRINVEELTIEMGVSRTPIWQAISILEKEGLVRSIPNKGVLVQTFTKEQLLDLYSVRETLECMAADLVVAHLEEDLLRELEDNLGKQWEVISKGDLAAFSRFNNDFHETIYQASQNGFLVEILNDIKKKLRPAVIHMDSILRDLYHDHVDIVNAFRNRNAAGAQNAFKMHNERKRNLLQEFMKTT